MGDGPFPVFSETPVIAVPLSLAGKAVWLTRQARTCDIHAAAPVSAIEGCEIVGHRSQIHGRDFHPRHESGRRCAIPLNVTNNPSTQSEGIKSEQGRFAEHSVSGAGIKDREIVGMDGTKSHIHAFPPGFPAGGAAVGCWLCSPGGVAPVATRSITGDELMLITSPTLRVLAGMVNFVAVRLSRWIAG
jgi:hypothetical protein